MAGSVSSGGRRGRWKPQAEINVTPFVDVMLVLLIVFMITAPLLTVGVEVQLPETDAQSMSADSEPLTVTVGANGEIFLQETPVELDQLVPRLRAISGAGYEGRIFIRGDENANYGEVARVMARISSAGYTNLGLVHSPGVGGRAADEQEE
ncbi:biopolymer transporter ExbD [Hyphobacterium sp. HN65]|uniref:Biopolymer transporter ExbD n=1 Tax=Hyphobacterium lacteum TaxID=3116575 RepID=A0ABU7LPR6_9PROT|nr:biopolymer transporter ExbD [Hyphobacterium sp. HN65]MEE2525908.1 biopolymer transporter ExbD [Hyphobacterium sp. HN65]